jgi:antitoxin MazE
MKTRIVRIGNSQGIRIPKPLLRQSGLEGEVEMEVEEGRIVIRAAEGVRKGWDDAFRAMAEEGDDAFLDDPTSTAWDDSEWEWE